ncbi:hypothetical protein DUNSADRAFT_17170 [Dunaliella salina]|uniref:MYND-type domain-containing protein n=1 Tax=Dunaliella salina TaxID=3046 RepID=A0ABQ7H0E1_DUNSA|nr:hypothetical protein DUNSADRAFT_17170 [Dunaliella salina]|eukprot:KAF5840326.1 hypothetical protein DUNSADRAFT_17170 [Dunaliella salina]
MPKLLALSLSVPLSSLPEVYGGLYSLLNSEFEVEEVKEEHDALRRLQRPSDYAAVLVTDGAIASADGRKIPYKQVRQKLQQYLEQGGTVICCGYMPNDASLLGGVNPQDQALYAATDNSCVESFVFAPTPIDRSKNESPVAFTQVSSGGHVGYVGDVNSEYPSCQVVLAMCRFAWKKANAAAASSPGVPAAACNGQEAKAGQGADQPHVCLHCGQSRLKMRRCGGCRKVRLCSEECQQASWPQHKLVCGKQ